MGRLEHRIAGDSTLRYTRGCAPPRFLTVRGTVLGQALVTVRRLASCSHHRFAVVGRTVGE